MSRPSTTAGATTGRTRKHRIRSIPKWLREPGSVDAIARSRCMLLLSVLSGEKPVTDAVREARISRALYYQLEARALRAMLEAMNPVRATSASRKEQAWERIAALEAQLKRREQECRRSRRLLYLVRLSNRVPMKTGRRGRWSRATPGSTSTPPGASSP